MVLRLSVSAPPPPAPVLQSQMPHPFPNRYLKLISSKKALYGEVGFAGPGDARKCHSLHPVNSPTSNNSRGRASSSLKLQPFSLA